jgi:hypothetical protein
MPVNITASKILYTGGSGATTFAFAFFIYAHTDLVVEVLDTNGNYNTLNLNTDYTVDTLTFPNNGNILLVPLALGGSWPVIPSGDTLIIYRKLPITQNIDISDYSPTPAKTWNEAFDRACMIEQQLQEQIGRAILQPIIVNSAALIPNPTAGYLLGWDSTGTYLTNYAPTGGGSVIQIPVPISQGGTGTGSTDYCSLTANVTGTLPIANGGTGSASTAYCSLTANVSGILPVANGGTGSANAANTASGVVILDSSAKLPAVDGSQLTGIKNSRIFTSNGTFTAPAGVTQVLLTMIGAGGSGGHGSDQYGGGGGGSGELVLKYPYVVTPLSTYAVVVGTGSTSFNSAITASPGGNGGNAGGSPTAGGTGAVARTGAPSGATAGGYKSLGGTDGAGESGGGGSTGVGGAGSYFGTGGAGAVNAPGGNATGYGAGGGGQNGGFNPGGTGSPGICIVEW